MGRQLPSLAAKMCYGFGGWVVGSAADPAADLKTVRDIDVMVPLSRWKEASRLIPPDAIPNTFGGWKCQSEDKEIDIWPDELSNILDNIQCKFVWQPHSGARWSRI